ncbi:MAG TPA: hypothetical protein PK331_07145 [Gordonia sp. (in: high G+C Gram-positive bacteria)]|uniref:hypothetical protein n=1 Tax=unclassified Gordonia (in: high G+C Gram-positive bacteria) TaxID=2657482 RepID=UPI000F9FBC89|nr:MULTISPECIES: hypothetical protein [unclassified Gordonia (in: high G+C Gram-positive bacteria)]RUP35500.1 MAG: hypothetical protein EKK60_17560 [Gordonia sp. (in: high G+C Gram-positive bacteria)]HNP57672.1 hypothetical protein [Gordonia sp. (in: high G+C Gram-positive bacteria)]HRC50683.1 hypothetical protein [Gordonia sp. (in: high G+C Gram-positive bacteria)]
MDTNSAARAQACRRSRLAHVTALAAAALIVVGSAFAGPSAAAPAARAVKSGLLALTVEIAGEAPTVTLSERGPVRSDGEVGEVRASRVLRAVGKRSKVGSFWRYQYRAGGLKLDTNYEYKYPFTTPRGETFYATGPVVTTARVPVYRTKVRSFGH